MLVWRLTRAPYADLSGRGGELASGRWHTKGRPVVYTAGTAALALLEVRVRLDLPLDLLPDDYVLMRIEAPDDLAVHDVAPGDLPEGWQGPGGEATVRAVGDAWLAAAEMPVLRVPSAVVEEERNLLINPRHHEAARIRVDGVRPFAWDGRLFAG